MKEFKNYHPVVNFAYFVAVIGLGMFLMHPVCLIISLTSSFVCLALARGSHAVWRAVTGILPVMIVGAFLNSMFNHQGVTILAYLTDGNPVTLEAILYGIGASVMLGAVICLFSCYSFVMTDDKFMYLFGKIMPSMALVISMTLGFVPKFKKRFADVVKAQKGLGTNIGQGGFLHRTRCAVKIMSVMTSWMLESSVETAISMKCRGYGLRKRTSFSLYTFTNRDFRMLCFLICSTGYVIFGYYCDALYFSYFPVMISNGFTCFSGSVFAVYFLLCMMPSYVELKEWIMWRAMKSTT